MDKYDSTLKKPIKKGNARLQLLDLKRSKLIQTHAKKNGININLIDDVLLKEDNFNKRFFPIDPKLFDY